MKIKLKDIRAAVMSMGSITKKKLPSKMGYAISKNLSLLEKEFKLIEEERAKICENYAEKDKEGKPITKNNIYKMTGANEKKCNEEFEEFLETETDIDFHLIPADLLELIDASDRFDTLTVAEVNSIAFLISD